MQFLKRLMGGAAPSVQPLAPDAPFCAVGDVHGCLDLLERLLASVPEDVAQLVMVGDYVDRGEDSAGVLRHLHDLQQNVGTQHMTCLMGNHEEMMLNFLAEPERRGRRWLRYGGLQTLSSFHISLTRPEPDAEELQDVADRLTDALGPDLLDWLLRLETSWTSGNITVVHAAADPDVALEDQSRETLLWGHPEFRRKARQDGRWVLHGHTIVDAPSADAGVISVDTGAYATGRLSAALLRTDSVDFIST